MYKVFIDNTCVLFKKNEKFSTNVGQNFLPVLDPEELSNFKNFLENNSDNEPFYFSGPKPLELLQSYFTDFNWIEAAGGVVKNLKLNKYLFIYRNNIWDLPKGKIEQDESEELAGVREVQEECGINDVQIRSNLPSTYHVYKAYGQNWIKKTYWYEMYTPDLDLKPQIEEGISKAEWLDHEEIENIRSNTYASLIEVIDGGIYTKAAK